MKPRRSIAIVAFTFLVFMSFFAGDDFIQPASSININNIDEVEIDCDQYMAGIETIDVYSNASVKNYALRINGTLLDSISNPVQYASHYWNNSFWQVRTGTQTGTDNGLVVNTNGSDYIAIASTGGGVRTAAGSFWFYNATAPDISYIQNATVYFSVMVSGAGAFNNLRFQRWNGLAATWTNEITVAGGSRGVRYDRQLFYTGANLTTMFAQRDSRTLNIGFGVQSEISGGGSSHTLYIYYLVILYKVNKPIEACPTFKLVDTHVLNTTAYADGTYNISASIMDFSNANFTDYKIVKIDNTKPSIPSISYSPASPNNTYPVTITSSVSDPNLDYSEGQYTNQFGYYITIPNYLSTSFTFKDFFTNGTYTFYFYARDKSGNYRSVSTMFTVSYVNDVVYIYNPVVEIEMEASKSDLGDPINYNITVQHVGRFKIYVNNTLNQTVENPSGTYSYFINSSIAAKFIVTFQVFYDNDTFFRNSTFTLYFAETDVIVYSYLYKPSVIVGYPSNTTTGATAKITMNCTNCGNIKAYVNGTLNQTFFNATDEYMTIASSTPKTFNVTIEIYYLNATFYKNQSFLVKFVSPTYVYVYNPDIVIGYPSNTTVGSQAKITLNCTNCGTIKAYVNGTLNQTFTTPTDEFFFLTSSTPKTFNVTIEIRYVNETFYKNASFLVVFSNQAIVTVGVPEPLVVISYPSNTTTGGTAKITLNCTNCGTIKAYVNGTLNQTFTSPDDEEFTLSSTVKRTFSIVIELRYTNGTFFQNVSFQVKFIEPETTFIYLPTFIYSYTNNTYDNATLDIFADNVQKVDVYKDGSLDFSFPGTSVDETFAYFSPVHAEYEISLIIYYLNGTMYKNITVDLVIRQYVAPVYALTIEPRRVDYKGEIVPSSYYDLFINGTKTTSLFIPFTPGDDIRVVFVSDFEDTMYDQLIVTGSSNMTVVAELDMYWLSLNNNRDDDVQVRISRNDIVLSIVLDPQTTKRVLLYDKTYAIEWILDYDATPGAVAPITDGGDLDMNDDRSVDFNPSGLQVTPLTIFIIIIGIGAAVGVFVVLGIQEFIVNVPGKKKTPSGRSTGSAAKTTSKAGRSSNPPRKSPVPRKKSSPQLRPRQRLHTRTRGMR